MSQKTYFLVVGLIFLLVALMHALRLIFGWNIEVNGWILPLWASWFAIVIAFYLSMEGFHHARKGSPS